MTTLILAADTIGLHKVSEWLKSLVAEWKRQRLVSQTLKELNKLSDRELRDIGISRCDIYTIAREPHRA